jgi:hypothetical protein
MIASQAVYKLGPQQVGSIKIINSCPYSVSTNYLPPWHSTRQRANSPKGVISFIARTMSDTMLYREKVQCQI